MRKCPEQPEGATGAAGAKIAARDVNKMMTQSTQSNPKSKEEYLKSVICIFANNIEKQPKM